MFFVKTKEMQISLVTLIKRTFFGIDFSVAELGFSALFFNLNFRQKIRKYQKFFLVQLYISICIGMKKSDFSCSRNGRIHSQVN